VSKRYPTNVLEVWLERTRRGFTYNGRGPDATIVYQCPRFFHTRRALYDEVKARWPEVKILE
jgi:hypothetical protein